MGYIAKYYDKKTLTEKVWHKSSMIQYTEMVEDPDENFGDLTVVFNNGSTYRYKDVSFQDYVLLVAGGIDASNGKTFNKVIKEHGYAYEKIDPLSGDYIKEGLQEYYDMMERRKVTYFISGPEDFTEEEFDHITCKLNLLSDTEEDKENTYFVIADSEKFANRVLSYLIDIMEVAPDHITVYTLKDTECKCASWNTKVVDAWDTLDEMDQNLTYYSNYDITILRNWETEITRESKNILRRYIYS